MDLMGWMNRWMNRMGWDRWDGYMRWDGKDLMGWIG